MQSSKIPHFCHVLLLASAIAALAAAPAAADWLITLDGRMIETRGPWTVDGERLTYVDLEGAEHTVALDQIDLEGSEETTALRVGESYEPASPEAEPEPTSAKQRAPEQSGEPKIVLYVGAMCRTCTRARELLEELDVDFEVLDIDSSVRARRQYEKKAGHGGGLPILDIDGNMVYTFHPGVVRRKIQAFLEKEKVSEDEPPPGDSEPAPGETSAQEGSGKQLPLDERKPEVPSTPTAAPRLDRPASP